MSKKDVRWHQRLNSFEAALKELASAVQIAGQRPLSKLEKQGLIQAFEFTHELAWNVMKDYFEFQGVSGITGSRDAAREAFRARLVTDGDIWMEMLKSRNQTTHTYNQKIADEISDKILKDYFPQLSAFFKKMVELKKL